MNPLFASHYHNNDTVDDLGGRASKPKVLPPKDKIVNICNECHTILNGTCLVIMDRGEPTYYFCDKKCKKDYIRINGVIK